MSGAQMALPFQHLSLEDNIDALQQNIATIKKEIIKLKAQRDILEEQLDFCEDRFLVEVRREFRGSSEPPPNPPQQQQPPPEQVPDKQDFQGKHGRPRGMWGQVSFDGE